MPSDETFLPPHGGYEQLASYQKALIVYRATRHFCRRFLSKRDRTCDQMVQAARSGKQNIVEGSQVSGTSRKLELNLTNVARASLEELIEDYRDFMRDRGITEWDIAHPCTRRMRELNRGREVGYETFRKAVEHADPAVCVNAIVGLIRLTTYLLDRQIRSLEQAFLENGGLSETMTQARLAARNHPPG